MTTQPPRTAPASGDEPVARPHWAPLTLVCFSYLAATVGEQVLSPVFPTTSDDLGLSESAGGIAFGTLAASIAVANLVGGALLRRHGVARLFTLAAAASTVGSVLAALAPGFGLIVVAQVFLGAGAGFFFPAGLQAVALFAGPARKGFAMGIYGVAFSGGLTLAAVLGTIGASQGWRSAFWVSAALSAAAIVVSFTLRVHATTANGPSTRVPLRVILGLPTAVGSVGAVCQYGAIPFLTTFAVAEWHLSKAGAAAVLAVGRVISIVAKLVSGAGADRVGPRASARSTGMVLVATGLAWVLLPGGWPAYALAAIFAGTVSSVFPVANLLALEQFGQNGTALGIYRSAQIGIGALAGAVIGLVGDVWELRPVLAIAVASPVLLLWFCREPAS